MKPSLLCTLALTCALTCGCSGTVDNDISSQRSSFESYFNSHNLDYSIQNGVYKCVVNSDRDGYDTAPVVSSGDSVYFYFEAYTFDSSPASSCYFSNRPDTIDTLAKYGLNPELWPYGPQKIKLGKTSLISGLNRGLSGCCLGDSVQLLISSDLAYDDKYVGVLEPNTAVLYILNIVNVIKE